jgi:hypothetical protein
MGKLERTGKGVGEEKAVARGAKGDGPGTERDGPPGEPQIAAAERLTIELARLRAKFGTDPAVPRASFDDAWMSPTAAMEEDEAEFIDAVADCLGVGLSLDAALTCWDTGGLFYDDSDAEDSSEDEDDGEPAAGVSLPAVTAHHHAHGRRLVIQ